MIVTEVGDCFQFVTQPAHAALAGQFADRWGNDAFERPEPRAAVLAAAYRHDAGWHEYDLRPHLDGDGRPVDFRSMPAGTWIDLYDDGIDAVAGVDPYAGLLVSMHGSGLRRRRYGLSPSWPPTPPEYEAFVDRQEGRQAAVIEELLGADRDHPVSGSDAELLSALHDGGDAPDGADSRLWRNYKLLQAWDTLSLSFCVTGSPPGSDRIDAVPAGGEGADEALSIGRLGDGTFRMEPYPFDSSPFAVSVPVRTAPKDAFDADGPVEAYYAAGRETRTFTIRRDAR